MNWQSYKQFSPENVYNTYMKYWKNVIFTILSDKHGTDEV